MHEKTFQYIGQEFHQFSCLNTQRFIISTRKKVRHKPFFAFDPSGQWTLYFHIEGIEEGSHGQTVTWKPPGTANPFAFWRTIEIIKRLNSIVPETISAAYYAALEHSVSAYLDHRVGISMDIEGRSEGFSKVMTAEIPQEVIDVFLSYFDEDRIDELEFALKEVDAGTIKGRNADKFIVLELGNRDTSLPPKSERFILRRFGISTHNFSMQKACYL